MTPADGPADGLADAAPLLGLAELADERRISRILLDNALHGIRIQVALRLLLAVFVLLTVTVDAPAEHAVACIAIAAAYAVWAVVGVVLAPRGGLDVIRWSWTALFVDLAVLVAVTLIAGASDETSWTADILVAGFFVVPMIAAVGLRPGVCAAVMIPTVVVFFVASALAKDPNGRPWSYILLSTLALATLAVGAVALSRLQRSRVVTIGSLAAARARLLDDVIQIEQRERRDLAEHLHDGALQYVLGARQELATLRDAPADPETIARIDEALRESGKLLRSTLGELHPAVLEQSGLAVALTDLARAIEHRSGMHIAVDTAGWPAGTSTPADSVLFSTARELLTNVVKHARASSVEVTAELDDGRARLVVLDDGIGIDDAAAARRISDGHIGLASRRTRLEGQGGSLEIIRRPGGGTVAIAVLPMTPAG
ncbi:ATP-binding protein [Gordonia sp. VNK1]|uniref:sensor histidine kinase n=1 Tax=Gordonia oleivorans TaxID=3156618 RepID=UPI0032B448F6